MGVLAKLLRRSSRGPAEETATAAPAAEAAVTTGTGSDTAKASDASETEEGGAGGAKACDGAAGDEGSAPSVTEATGGGTEIPRQQSADEAADNEAGESARK